MRITWIRVATDLPEHPKSKLLELELGERNAWAYVARLWMWCSNYAQDGRIPNRMVGIAERSAGWTGDEGRLFAHLLSVGFLEADDGAWLAHKWEEHQGSAIKRAENDAKRKKKFRNQMRRGRDADATRTVRGQSSRTLRRTSGVPDLTGPDLTGPDGTEEEKREKAPAALAAAPPPSGPDVIQETWNKNSPPLPRWREHTKSRKESARARWDEHPDAGYWSDVCARIAASDFCKGKNDRGWKAGPDFLLRPDTAVKVLEGAYDNHRGSSLLRETTADEFREQVDKLPRDENGYIVLPGAAP